MNKIWPKTKPNDLIFMLLALIYLTPILLSDNALLCLVSVGLAFINLIFLAKINYKYLGFMVLFLLIPIFSVFITVLIYTKGAAQTPLITTIWNFPIYQLSFDTAIFLTARAWSLSIVSFIFLLAMHSDALVISLMQNLKLPVKIGYALLATFNAFSYMKDEFLRIRLAYRMRFQKQIFPMKLLLPVLVSASRYAHYAGLSLESKGLNEDKSYTVSHFWNRKDWVILIFNLIQIIVLILIFKLYIGVGIALV